MKTLETLKKIISGFVIVAFLMTETMGASALALSLTPPPQESPKPEAQIQPSPEIQPEVEASEAPVPSGSLNPDGENPLSPASEENSSENLPEGFEVAKSNSDYALKVTGSSYDGQKLEVLHIETNEIKVIFGGSRSYFTGELDVYESGIILYEISSERNGARYAKVRRFDDIENSLLTAGSYITVEEATLEGKELTIRVESFNSNSPEDSGVYVLNIETGEHAFHSIPEGFEVAKSNSDYALKVTGSSYDGQKLEVLHIQTNEIKVIFGGSRSYFTGELDVYESGIILYEISSERNGSRHASVRRFDDINNSLLVAGSYVTVEESSLEGNELTIRVESFNSNSPEDSGTYVLNIETGEYSFTEKKPNYEAGACATSSFSVGTYGNGSCVGSVQTPAGKRDIYEVENRGQYTYMVFDGSPLDQDSNHVDYNLSQNPVHVDGRNVSSDGKYMAVLHGRIDTTNSTPVPFFNLITLIDLTSEEPAERTFRLPTVGHDRDDILSVVAGDGIVTVAFKDGSEFVFDDQVENTVFDADGCSDNTVYIHGPTSRQCLGSVQTASGIKYIYHKRVSMRNGTSDLYEISNADIPGPETDETRAATFYSNTTWTYGPEHMSDSHFTADGKYFAHIEYDEDYSGFAGTGALTLIDMTSDTPKTIKVTKVTGSSMIASLTYSGENEITVLFTDGSTMKVHTTPGSQVGDYSQDVCAYLDECEGAIHTPQGLLDVVVDGDDVKLHGASGIVANIELENVWFPISKENFSADGKTLIVLGHTDEPTVENGGHIKALASVINLETYQALTKELPETFAYGALQYGYPFRVSEVESFFNLKSRKDTVHVKLSDATEITMTWAANAYRYVDHEFVRYFDHEGQVRRSHEVKFNHAHQITYYSDFVYLDGVVQSGWEDTIGYEADGITKKFQVQVRTALGGYKSEAFNFSYSQGVKVYEDSYYYDANGLTRRIINTWSTNSQLLSHSNKQYDVYGNVASDWLETRSYYADGTAYSLYQKQVNYGVIAFDILWHYHANGLTSYYKKRGFHSTGAIYEQDEHYYNTAGQLTYQRLDRWHANGASISTWIDSRSYYSVGGQMYALNQYSYVSGVLRHWTSQVYYTHGGLYYSMSNAYHASGHLYYSYVAYYNWYGGTTYSGINYYNYYGQWYYGYRWV